MKNDMETSEQLSSRCNEQLARLKMPVFVLLGGRDVTMDSNRIKHRFEQHVDHAEILLEPNAGHYLGDQSLVISQFLRRAYSEQMQR